MKRFAFALPLFLLNPTHAIDIDSAQNKRLDRLERQIKRLKNGGSSDELKKIKADLTQLKKDFYGASAIAAKEGGYAPPKYRVMRYEEDWSTLPKEGTGDKFDPLKKIDLTKSGNVWMSIGGSFRVRWENFKNFSFAPANDDQYVLRRFFIHNDLHITKYFRLFIEGKAADVTTRDLPGLKRTLDTDSNDINNAFAQTDFYRKHLGVRVGRQEMELGAQRLVSSLNWANTRRAFNGVRGWWKDRRNRLDLFYMRPLIMRRYEANSSNDNTSFYGVYGTSKFNQKKHGVDYYLMTLHTSKQTTDTDRHTAGLRLWGPLMPGFSFEAEGAYQFGEIGSGAAALDIKAYMLSAQLNHPLKGLYGNPVFSVGADLASGDKNATDNESNTFNQLFPLGHAYFGWADVVGRQNVVAYKAQLKGWPIKKRLLIISQFHVFALADINDALYNPGGAVVRPATPTADRDVGNEVDLKAKIILDRHWNLLVGYSHFSAGDFIKQTTPTSKDDIEFLHAAVNLTF